ncbi:MAG: OmpP1/FadL family transporter [Bacteroidota bacterium]
MRTFLIVISFLFLPVLTSHAQFPEDALRLSTLGVGVGGRALGMGNAFTAVSDDYTAIFWNPAGLAQIRRNEFSAGISHLGFDNRSTFFGSQRNFSNNKTSLDNVGVVYPLPTRRGNAVVALGYNRSNEFATALSFDGFNPSSSIVPSLFRSDTTRDIAFLLALEGEDGSTPIQSNVRQFGTVLEAGGINRWTAAGAIDVASDLSVGLSLNFLTGSYRFTRNYTEEDSRNIHTMFPFDFDALELDNTVDADIVGFTAKFGLHYRKEPVKLGLAVKTPSWFDVQERFSTSGRSFFDDGFSSSARINGTTDYNVATPFVFSAGAALTLMGLTISGDADFTDWTQMEFRDATPELEGMNIQIKEIFKSTVNWRLGAEYELQPLGLRLRSGFIMNRSPYRGDPSSFNQKFVTGGLGLNVDDMVFVDAAYARGWWKTFRVNYVDPFSPTGVSRTDEDVNTDNFLLTVSFRF